MNISLKWLKQYLDFDLTAQEVGDALTSLGLEVGAVEEVETIRGGLKGIVVGKVLTTRTSIKQRNRRGRTAKIRRAKEKT